MAQDTSSSSRATAPAVLGAEALAVFAGAARLSIGCRCAISGASKQIRQVEGIYKSRADAPYKINLDYKAAMCEAAGLSALSSSTDPTTDFSSCTPAIRALCEEAILLKQMQGFHKLQLTLNWGSLYLILNILS